MRKSAEVIAILCLISIVVLGFAIYVYSIYFAAAWGWIAVLLTIALPVFAQIYWIAVAYLATGNVLNTLLHGKNPDHVHQWCVKMVTVS